jgi:hypothetical protein
MIELRSHLYVIAMYFNVKSHLNVIAMYLND